MEPATAIIMGLVLLNVATVAISYIQMKQMSDLNQYYYKLIKDHENLVYAQEESVKALRKNTRSSILN